MECCHDLSWQDTQLQLASQISIENRLLALEGDKECLKLQMTAISDRLQSQSEKVGALKRNVEEKVEALAHTEDQVHQELLSRSSLETRQIFSLKYSSFMTG